MLGQTRRDGLSEAMWAVGGVAIGLTPQVLGSLYVAYFAEKKETFGLPDALAMAIWASCIAVAACIFFVSITRSKKAATLASTIRSRSSV